MGKSIAGDDMLGLVRSFYLGGATTVLSSLWPVDDLGTKVFMEVFHRSAAKGNYAKGWLEARDALKSQGCPRQSMGRLF